MSKKERSQVSTGREGPQAVSRIGLGAGGEDAPTVQLVPLSLDHAQATAAWLEDPDVAGGLGLRRQPTLENTRAWIELAEDDPQVHAFAIVAGRAHVGNVVLDLLDDHLATARLSIYVGERAARGASVAQTAVRRVAEHATEVLHLHKLWLTVHVGNAPALAAYARCGFVAEGILRGEFMLHGERTDVMRMGLLLGPPSRQSR